jgi:2-keto-4-pentenoate hydratase/2-oxohepta-3-ene-1,7-dioic acid hydratase in catechol pathway
MRLVQYYENQEIRVGVMEGDRLVPTDFDGDMVALLKEGKRPKGRGSPRLIKDVTLAPPISRPSKIIALGLNYRDHAEESKGKIPEVPLVFAKFPNSLIGPDGEIVWDPMVTEKVDYEAELAVVIGTEVRDCPEDGAMEAVFGYCCGNDVSARDLQFGDGQWVRGKSLDTFCPLGPWMVTKEDVPDPHDLGIRCLLNDRLMQDSHTSLMIFRIPFIIHFLSRHFTLFPGDIILTGTPSGVGAFRDPSVYLKDGDRVAVEIERVGRLENVCRTG